MKSVIYTLRSQAEELQIKLNRDKAGIEMLSPRSRKQVKEQLDDHRTAIRKISQDNIEDSKIIDNKQSVPFNLGYYCRKCGNRFDGEYKIAVSHCAEC